MSDANSSGDSNELEALFDSIASGVTRVVPPVAAAAPSDCRKALHAATGV